MHHKHSIWWTWSLRVQDLDRAYLLAEVFNSSPSILPLSTQAQMCTYFFDVKKVNVNLC